MDPKHAIGAERAGDTRILGRMARRGVNNNSQAAPATRQISLTMAHSRHFTGVSPNSGTELERMTGDQQAIESEKYVS